MNDPFEIVGVRPELLERQAPEKENRWYQGLIMRVICATKGLAGLLLLQVGIGKLPDIGFPDHAGRLHWNTGIGFLTNIVL
mgnify:CR=1 FL=1